MTEVSSTLGLEDVYTLLEILAVDTYNRRPPDKN